MTQSDYARHAGLSRARVCQLVKAGMPLKSPEAADEWRGSFAQKLGPTASKEKPPGKEEPAAAPVELPEPEGPGPYRPPEAEKPVDKTVANADTAQGAYERQKQIERAAFALAARALKERQPDAARLVSIHAQAARNLAAARLEVLELAERERTLVSGDWVRKAMTDHDGVIVQLVKALPRQLAARIAPHDPEHAEAELDRWVQTFLKTVHGTNPWAT